MCVTAKNRHAGCPRLIEHNTQRAYEAQGKLGVVKVHQMEHSITHNVSETLTLDVVDPIDKTPNRPTTLPVYESFICAVWYDS